MHNTAGRFGTITKTFHWLTALLILTAIVLGIMAQNAGFATANELAHKAWLFSFHKTIGITAFFVALGRIAWAFTQPKPDTLNADKKAEVFMAGLVHWLLYASMVIVPLMGWITHAASEGFAPIWWPFGQSLPLIPKSVGLSETAGVLHVTWEKILVVSILLHVAGALKHHVIDKDGTLKRMWFGGTSVTGTPHKAGLIAPIAAAVIYGLVGIGAVMFAPTHDSAAGTVELAQTQSDWVVQDGTLSIAVDQFGSVVNGSFQNWTADISYDPATQKGDVTVTIDIASLTLGSVTDQALGADYFDAGAHPTAVFAGPITPTENGHSVRGTLNLRGVDQPVDLLFTLTETDGGFQAMGETVLQRLGFGIGQSQPDGGTLGLDVVVKFDLTVTKKAP